MKIVQVNSANRFGGAARAAYQLHLGLKAIGADSHFFCLEKTEDDPTVFAFEHSKAPGRVLATVNRMHLLRERWAEYNARIADYCELFSPEWDAYGEEMGAQLADADLINMHWVSMFIDIPWMMSFAAKSRIPVVWTLHDMNPFTGGCHYNWGCRKFETACGACPQLTSDDPDDWAHAIQAAKLASYPAMAANADLTIVSPSRWLADEARRSAAMRDLPVEVIPNSVDEAVYTPTDRSFAREVIGIPVDAKVLMFISQSVANPRKGVRELLRALTDHVATEDLTLLVVGSQAEYLADIRFPMVRLGTISDDKLLAVVYSAADAMVISSIQDNLPNTILESLACGTAVIGSDTGGIPDMVIPGETGYLAEAGSAAELGKAIDRAFADIDGLRKMGANGRALVERKFASAVQAHAYNDLYTRIVAQRAESAATGNLIEG